MIIDSKTGKRFVGFFKGKVLSHLANGTCKIWIPGVYPEEWCAYSNDIMDVYGNPLRGAKLPTANPSFPPIGGDGPNGIFSIPALNSMVWCFFENDDSNYPVYFASIPGTRTNDILNEMTEKTKDHLPGFELIKNGKEKLERDVVIRFGRAYILFSPNDRIEIGFKATEKKKGEIEKNVEAIDDPKIIVDSSGKIQLISQGGIELIGQKNAGIRLASSDNEIRVNKTGTQITSYGEEGGVVIDSTKTLELYSDYNVDIQLGERSFPGPSKRKANRGDDEEEEEG